MQFNYDTYYIKLTIYMWFQANDARLWDITFEYILCTLEIVCIGLIMFSIAATPQSTVAFF